jgi:hypothetical protein
MTSLSVWAASKCGKTIRFGSADPAALSSNADTFLDAITLILSNGGILDGGNTDVMATIMPIGRDLAMGYIGITAPWIVFAALMLFCSVPLCIARCCAHKCCRPALDLDSDVPKTLPSQRLKRLSVACLAILGIGALVCALIGLLAIGDFGNAALQPFCAIDGVMDSVGSTMGDAITAVNDINGSVTTVATTFTDIRSTLDLVKEKVSTTCDAVADLADAVQSLSDDGYPVSALLTEVNAAGTLCLDLTSTVPTAIDSADGQLSTYADLIEMAASTMSTVLTTMRGFETSIGTFDGSIGDLAVTVTSSSPSIESIGSSIGLGIFIVPILLIGMSLLIAPCMVRTEQKNRCCTVASCGVQILGCAWVFGAIFCVVYFLIGAVVVSASTISNDVAIAIRTVPTHFRSTFDGTMLCGDMAPAGAPLAFATAFNLLLNSSYVSTVPPAPSPPPNSPLAVVAPSPLLPSGVCELIELALDTCWIGDGDGSTLIDSMLDALDSPYNVSGLESQISGLESQLAALNLDDVGFNSTEVRSLIDTVDTSVAALTTADLGLTSPGDPQCAAAQTALDDLKAKALVMAAEGTQLLSYFEEVVELVGGLPALLTSTLQNTLDSAVSLTECGWIKTEAVLVISAVLGISSTLYVFASVGLILCSIFMCLFIPAAISMQIAHGGVGAVPGCPGGCCKGKAQVVPDSDAGSEFLAEGAEPNKKGWRKSKGDGAKFDKTDGRMA